MKKIIAILFCLFITINSTKAYETKENTNGFFESLIQKIGFNILNANKIPYNTSFFVYKKTNAVNAGAKTSNREIIVFKDTFNYLTDEDEVAAILSHEIAHVVESNQGIFKGYFSTLSYALTPRKYEYKADKLGVDYMVKAGYNPLAMIVMLNKIGGQTRYEWYSSHPLTTRRMAEVYEYIYEKYPQFLVDNKKYEDCAIYQNFLLTSKENRKKLQTKLKTNSSKRLRYE